MKVLIIFNGPYPVGPVSTHRVHHICKGLVENGVEMELLIPIPTENYRNIINFEIKGVHEGVQFRYISATTQRAKGFIARRLSDFFCHLKTIFYVLTNGANSEVTLIIGPSFDFRLFLPIAIKLTKSKSVLEINEYPFVNHKPGISLRIKRFVLLKLVIPLYNGFIVISEELVNFLEQYKAKEASLIKVPILGSACTNPITEQSPFDVPYILHAGSLFERKDGILGMVKAFGLASKKLELPVKFVFTGSPDNSPEADGINQLIREFNLEDRIIFTGYLSNKKLSNYLQYCSLAIINKDDNKQNKYCFATKLADYLFNAIPVITTNVGEVKKFLSDGINAYVLGPGNPEAIADKIILAFSDPVERRKIGTAGHSLAEKEFDYRKHGLRIAKYLNDLAV